MPPTQLIHEDLNKIFGFGNTRQFVFFTRQFVLFCLLVCWYQILNFPVTDNAEDELVDYLEARLPDVLVDASFSSAKKRDGAHFRNGRRC